MARGLGGRGAVVLAAAIAGVLAWTEVATGQEAGQEMGEATEQEADARLATMATALEAAREDLIEVRRDIHRHPEPSGQEERTAALVADRLRVLGLDVETGVGGHGVVGVLRGGLPGPVVAYRADMDAVHDNSPDPVPFRSEVPGVRHICGHDIHTTVALGVAEALASIRDELTGTVKFVFQPAEENVQGARAMIEDGVLEDPSPSAIFAVHTAPLEVGQIGAIEGLGLPGMDHVRIKVSGGGDPGETARAAARLISGVSTVGPPGSPEPEGDDFIWANARSVLASGGDGYVVVGSVKASGDEAYATAKKQIQEGLELLVPEGTEYSLEYRDRVLPDMVNDVQLVRESYEPLRLALGEENLIPSGSTPYFGEDFAFYQQVIPGAMYWLGVSNSEKGTVGMPHSPGYVADEESIMVGSKAMAAVLLDYLDRAGSGS
jgi:metal-dependent amidase/aminoacylase/carboxypeptidase family protein